jgi:predicted short-subunit dehydrogenase-like oxidoreductase (DUF2520 family)
MKREDKLLLERALRALEDVDQSLKEFSATASLRSSERATQRSNFASAIVGALWDRTFDFEFRQPAVQKRASMALFRVKPTEADIAVANTIAAHTGRPAEHIAQTLTWGGDEHVLCALAIG